MLHPTEDDAGIHSDHEELRLCEVAVALNRVRQGATDRDGEVGGRPREGVHPERSEVKVDRRAEPLTPKQDLQAEQDVNQQEDGRERDDAHPQAGRRQVIEDDLDHRETGADQLNGLQQPDEVAWEVSKQEQVEQVEAPRPVEQAKDGVKRHQGRDHQPLGATGKGLPSSEGRR